MLLNSVKDERNIPALIEGCLQNNRKAQECLYRMFYGFTMTIALRYARDELDAADIMSHAFMKIFKSIHRYDRQKGSLHAWIRKVVINEGLNHLNQRKQYLDTVELETAEAPEISNAALVKMSATDIMRFIRKLPPATHSVFVLFAIEGYSHREISRSLGISEGTSKWHLNEARKSLQRSILIHNADGREDNI